MSRPVGHFCWINVLAPDLDAEKAFFAAAVGWTFHELPGFGWRILVEGRQAGGLFPNAMPDGRRVPAGIGVMVRVADAAIAAERMRALGGRAEAPMPVGVGIMVDGADPEGAMMDLWQSPDLGTAQHDPEAEGAPFWFELMSRDVPAAVAFYGALFGWTARQHHVGDPPYTVLSANGQEIGGIMAMPPHLVGVPAFWGVYLHVRNVDAAVARVAEAGGQCFLPAQDVAGVGRFAGIVSPGGVRCYVMAPAIPAPPPVAAPLSSPPSSPAAA